MPAIENVTRRGATYWWRRRLRFPSASDAPKIVTVTASLQTMEQAAARHRGAAMTGRSEVVRMSLYQKIEEEGLTADQAARIFQDEMIRYRNMLAYQHSAIQADGVGDVLPRLTQMLSIYEAVNGDFATNGFADFMGIDYVGSFDRRFASLDDDARHHLRVMLSHAEELPGNLLEEARSLLARATIPATTDRLELARRVMCEARSVAAASYNDPAINNVANVIATVRALAQNASQAAGHYPIFGPSEAATTDRAGAILATAMPSTPDIPATTSTIVVGGLTDDQKRYARMTPIEAVEEYMRIKPKAGVRQAADGSVFLDNPNAIEGRKRKSQPKVWGDSQRRQFKAAAFLFEKSSERRPLSSVSQDDLVDFYDRLNRLPSSHHKSPRHDAMSLEEICDEAQSQIADGTAGSFTVGLDVGTINRHFANIKRQHTWYATKTPVAALDFSDFILEEDDRDDRDERDPYTIEQGRELFGLAIWTGSASLAKRLTPLAGGSVWHDAAYWVMPIVWFSGMRREEACKLLVDDIGEEDGIFYFNIRKTHAGTVKTATSKRLVPICSELRRLGFLDYVAAMRAEGEIYLFPEILPGRGGRALGDVFYKQVWLSIKPNLTLVKPGQAVHSGRHMVSTELKMLQTFEEFRSDLLGQKGGGLNASRYAGATRLTILLDIVERIPVVTAQLPRPTSINLLPKELRQPRPIRESRGPRRK